MKTAFMGPLNGEKRDVTRFKVARPRKPPFLLPHTASPAKLWTDVSSRLSMNGLLVTDGGGLDDLFIPSEDYGEAFDDSFFALNRIPLPPSTSLWQSFYLWCCCWFSSTYYYQPQSGLTETVVNKPIIYLSYHHRHHRHRCRRRHHHHHQLLSLSYSASLFIIITACGDQVNVSGNAGRLTSPGYPGDYPNSVNLCYVITLEQSGPQKVSVSITYNLELEANCGFDSIEVNQDKQLYCGSGSVNKSFEVPGRQWVTVFKTDGTVTKPNGFVIDYSLVWTPGVSLIDWIIVGFCTWAWCRIVFFFFSIQFSSIQKL